MPLPPYDTVETALNMARVRINDAIGNGLAGQVLTDLQPFTIQVINSGWRRLQSELAKLGFTKNIKTVVFLAVPAAASTDAALICYLNWGGYFDGAIQQAAPVLPQDFIVPLSMQERANGSGTVFYTMDGPPAILPPMPYIGPGLFNNFWTWANETIYLRGTLGLQDLQLEYAAYLDDFTAGSYGTQPIPIMRSALALSLFIAAEVAKPRGGDAGDKILGEAQAEVLAMVGRENPGVLVPKEAA